MVTWVDSEEPKENLQEEFLDPKQDHSVVALILTACIALGYVVSKI